MDLLCKTIARALRHRRHHQRHLYQMGRRIPGAPSGSLDGPGPHRRGRDRRLPRHTAIPRRMPRMNLARGRRHAREIFPGLDMVLIEIRWPTILAADLFRLNWRILRSTSSTSRPATRFRPKGGPGITRSDLLVINKDRTPRGRMSARRWKKWMSMPDGMRGDQRPLCHDQPQEGARGWTASSSGLSRPRGRTRPAGVGEGNLEAV